MPETTRQVFTVSALSGQIRDLLESRLSLVWVEGEIASLSRPASGHLYFSLKDGAAQLRCALFRGQQQQMKVQPKEGMQVLVRARTAIYEPRGDLQLIVNHLEEAGEGALRRAFEELKRKLEAEGLFAAERKRELPTLPACIGIISSASGAALHDILTTLQRRFPSIPVRLYPATVQGHNAVPELCQALENAAEDRRCDVLLLARGGGSLEDLKAFNDEALARAIVASPIPVVSGVGHEVDITIADLVADRRAATPTAAAELVTPDRFEWIARIRQLLGRLEQAATTRLQARSQRVDFLGARLADPSAALRTHNHRLSNLVLRLGQDRRQAVSAARLRTSELATRLQRCGPQLALQRIGSRLQRSQERLAARQRELEQQRQSRVQTLSQRLTAVGPAGTLARGYAILQRTDGTVVRAASEAPAGQKLRARLARGALDLTVDRSEGDDAG